MIIQRVELPNGDGPYNLRETMWTQKNRIEDQLDDMYHAHRWDADEARPTPPAEIPGLWNLTLGWTDWYCAFECTDALRWWFDGYLEKLHELGFGVALYEVPSDRVVAGSKQVVFDREFARLLGRDSLLNALEVA